MDMTPQKKLKPMPASNSYGLKAIWNISQDLYTEITLISRRLELRVFTGILQERLKFTVRFM